MSLAPSTQGVNTAVTTQFTTPTQSAITSTIIFAILGFFLTIILFIATYIFFTRFYNKNQRLNEHDIIINTFKLQECFRAPEISYPSPAHLT